MLRMPKGYSRGRAPRLAIGNIGMVIRISLGIHQQLALFIELTRKPRVSVDGLID
ncbi:MAG: hypothetical protein K6T34_04695 [Thermoflavifilum sp.]|nr:hypothetical protein [Thermoflavifilum sp.]